MQKTRLNSDTRHGIGNHLIDVAAEVGDEVVSVLVVFVVPTGRVLNGKEHPLRSKNSAHALKPDRRRPADPPIRKRNDKFAILISDWLLSYFVDEPTK